MAGIAAKISLTKKQEEVLKKLTNSRTVATHYRGRACIILHCATGSTNLVIKEALGISKVTVSKWRTRWGRNQEKLVAIEKEEAGIAYQRAIENILSDAPRSGTPGKFSAEQICQIMHVACETPLENEMPFSHWSLSSLAAELVKRKIVESISTSKLQVFLKSGKHKAA
jgi:putative transposase